MSWRGGRARERRFVGAPGAMSEGVRARLRIGSEKTLSSAVWMDELECWDAVPLARSQECSRDMGWEGVGFWWRFGSLVGEGASVVVLMWMWMGGSWGEWLFVATGLCLPIGGGSIRSESRRLRYVSGFVWLLLRCWLLLRLRVRLRVLWRPDFFDRVLFRPCLRPRRSTRSYSPRSTGCTRNLSGPELPLSLSVHSSLSVSDEDSSRRSLYLFCVFIM